MPNSVLLMEALGKQPPSIFTIISLKKDHFNTEIGDFSDSQLVKMACFHYKGHGFDPCLGK